MEQVKQTFKQKIIKNVLEAANRTTECHIGAYAAQAAYFFVLSLIPIILLLITMVQFTPATKADVLTALMTVFPEPNMQELIVNIVNQVYNLSQTIIPVTVIVALWSAGKGVLAIATGLNCIYGTKETRNYFFVRIRASLYTAGFLFAIVVGLVLAVFGTTLHRIIQARIPFVSKYIDPIIDYRGLIMFTVIFFLTLLINKFLPNWKVPVRKVLFGGIFVSVGWLVISWFFSMYLNIFTGFTGLYGSMTAIILVLLWMYMCMYILLLGALANVLVPMIIADFFPNAAAKKEKTVKKKAVKEKEVKKKE